MTAYLFAAGFLAVVIIPQAVVLGIIGSRREGCSIWEWWRENY